MTAIPSSAPAARTLPPASGPAPLPPAAATGRRWAARALVALAVVATTVLGAGTTAANATFSDSAALSATTVGTGTVAPATGVKVDAYCTTTTTVIKRYYRTDPSTGATWQTAWSQTSSTTTSRSNVESNTTTPPSWTSSTDYSTTQTVQDTTLYATLRWTLSTATRVTGYRMTAHTSVGAFGMGTTGPTATSMTGQYDASVTAWNPRLSIDTLTDYGWVGTSALSNVVRC